MPAPSAPSAPSAPALGVPGDRPLSPAALAAIEVGRRHEAGLDEATRRGGAHYTPPGVAAGLADLALGCWRGRGLPRVLDPAAGGGALLVAVADRLVDAGVTLEQAWGTVRGVELDPAAAAVATAALERWAVERGRPPSVVAGAGPVQVGDGLDLGAHGADVVVANPPFGGQRRRHTVRSGDRNAALRDRLGPDVVDLTADTAAVFLHAAAAGLAPDGVAAVLQPRPVLATAGAAGVRRALSGALHGVWLPDGAGFDAAVDVCAVVTGPLDEVRAGPVVVWRRLAGAADAGAGVGADTVEVARAVLGNATWAGLVAVAEGVPELGPVGAVRLGDRAEVAAGFRDEFYGIAAVLSEGRPSGAAAPLWTTAHVDPGSSGWGRRPVRVAGRRWQEPWVDLDRLEREATSRVVRWVGARRVPKVVVASQTRLIEAVADPTGEAVPLTPLVSVTSTSLGVDHLVAALTAPPATVWAHHHHGASGRSRGALRLSGRELLGLPLPTDRSAWDELAVRLRVPPPDEAAWREVGRVGCRAWGWSGDGVEAVVDWWCRRLPSVGHRTMV